MDYTRTYNSLKDEKLQRGNVKKFEDVVINDDGLTIKALVKDFTQTKQDFLKFEDEALKSQSENLQLFNKMNNTLEILSRKIEKLENAVSLLLSNGKNE